MIVRINCDRCPDSWRPVTLHPLNGLPIKLLAALSVYSMEGAVAHVLSVDLVKHNRGGFKGPEGTGGDLDCVQAGLAERQVGTEEFLRAACCGSSASNQKTNNA